jgi:hypothetical protein
MYDNYIARSESDQNLRERLTGVVPQEEVERIIEDFHKEKWEYCPLSLTLDMDRNLHGTRVIPPFCSKIKLPDKGGTASIYWVAVQKDLVSDNALALALQDSIYMDPDFGEVSFLEAYQYHELTCSVLPNGAQVLLRQQKARLRNGERGIFRVTIERPSSDTPILGLIYP